MSSWPALLIAPLLVLVEQQAVYALTTPACRHQGEALLHVLPLAALLIALLLTGLAWARLRTLRREQPWPIGADAPDAPRAAFVAQVAVGIGALSALVIVALWIPLWVLPACVS